MSLLLEIAPEPALDPAGVRALDDDALMDLQRDLAAARRRVDASSAVVAGELARRSRRDLGYGGLAQRLGARTPERLVSTLTGVSVGEARAMVAVGQAMDDDDASSGWMAEVIAGVAEGDVSVGAAAAIRAGLGSADAGVSADELERAARRLAVEVGTLAPEQVAQRARAARDELDARRVVDRERALRERRSLRLIPLDDGMTRVTGLLDPESAAIVGAAFDRVTVPRRGGVRFVDPAEQARSAAIEADVRSTEQLALDAFVQMVRLAAAVDDGTVFGSVAPAVRVHVTLADLQRGAGAAELEGQSDGVGVPTVRRFICESGTVPILFDDDGRAMDVGRTQRLHTARQRIAIAARDGGCLIRGCDRPPSWSEVHHIQPWESGGGTSVDDGVLLCRHHHMWVHDTGRRIERVGARYRLLDPGGGPPEWLASKSRVR